MEGWRAHAPGCRAVCDEDTKDHYHTVLVHARSHVGLAELGCSHEQRKEMYAFAPALVTEFLKNTEAALDQPWRRQSEIEFMNSKIAAMHQTLSELLNLLGTDGKVGLGVELPNHGLLTQSQVFYLGADHAKKALMMRKPGGCAPNSEAMGACLYWMAKNMVDSPQADVHQLLAITKESRARFAELDLPADHFRTKQVVTLIEQLESRLPGGGTLVSETLNDAPADDGKLHK